MRYPLRGLRFRLAAVYVAWFGGLLAVGAIFLYLVLERSRRADMDRVLDRTLAAAQDIYSRDRAEFPTIPLTVSHIVEELIYADRAMVAYDSTGRILARSRSYPGAPDLSTLGSQIIHQPRTVRTPTGGARVRTVELAGGVRLLVGLSLAPIERQRRTLLVAMILGLPILLVASALVGVLSARPALRPVAELAQAAAQAGRILDQGGVEFPPIPVSRVGDEVGLLSEELDRLLRRLQEELRRERAFLADAAHELRTPLAIVRSEAEAALASPRDGERDTAALGVIAGEAERMGSVVGDLLLLARGASGEWSAPAEEFYLDDAVSHVLTRVSHHPAASNRSIQLGAFEAVPVTGSRPLVERALLSLLENALVHAAPGPVEVSTGVSREGGKPPRGWVRVRDWGPGIPAGSVDRLFERFARGNTTAPGSGLGLAIARRVAEHHGGSLTHRAPPGGGAVFELALPLATG